MTGYRVINHLVVKAERYPELRGFGVQVLQVRKVTKRGRARARHASRKGSSKPVKGESWSGGKGCFPPLALPA